MDSSKALPTRDMLPPFRVRQVRWPTGDAVVRMKKQEYDELLKTQPSAALRYMDESDGEVILVGSSFELDQRLQEPVENAPRAHAGLTLDLYGTGSRPLHTFDIEKSEEVTNTWQRLDQRTTEEGQKAKSLFFGRKQPPPVPAKEPISSSSRESNPTSTPLKSVRFGQPSPPRSILSTSDQAPTESSHTSRWAAYSNLPGSFDPALIPVSPPEPAEKELLLPSVPTAPPSAQQETGGKGAEIQSLFDFITQVDNQHVRSSTLQVPSTPKQKTEHQPLLETFWKTDKHEEQHQEPEVEPKQYQPLLDMFEKKLNKLGSGPAPSDGLNIQQHSENTQLFVPPSEAANPLQTPGELLTHSIQSLISGMGQLASAFKLTNSELQQQVLFAQRDFPNNIERAIKSSSASIDSLIRSLSQVQSSSSATTPNVTTEREQEVTSVIAELDNQDQVSKPTEMGTGENKKESNSGPPTKTQSSAAIMKELQAMAREQEEKRQNERVDYAVEQMRLTLLSIGWRAPTNAGRVYTRADVLEDFLSYFEKMRADTGLPEGSKLETTEETKIRPSRPRPVPVAPEMKELEKPLKRSAKSMREHPYAWDLAFEPESDVGQTDSDTKPSYTNEKSGPSTTLVDVEDETPAELADESVLKKYPPVSELMDAPIPTNITVAHRPVSYPSASSKLSRYVPTSNPVPSPLRFQHSSSKIPSPRSHRNTKPPSPVEPKTAASGPRDATGSTLWETSKVFSPTVGLRDTGFAPYSGLVPQASMPSLSMAYKTQQMPGDQPSDDSTPSWQQYKYGPLRRSATTVRKATSTSNLLFRPSALARSNTVGGNTAKPAPPPPRVPASLKNIESCRKQLLEMGFDGSRSATVSEAVMGDMERAIDILEEDESARRQVKGKGRTKGKGKAMPGAFDEELYG